MTKSNKKKFFIVAPNFPPSFLPPSQRVRLMIPHCTKFGFFPIVFTVDHQYREEDKDDWMTELLGQQYEEQKVRCFDQKKTRRFKIGDLGLRMLPFLPGRLTRHAKKEKPSFILYLVPPWYILIAAPIVKFFTGIPYGIDFIDPWVYELKQGGRHSSKKKISHMIAVLFEAWVCRNAAIIYSVSQGINEELIKRHPKLSKKPMYAIPYGAEENDFRLIKEKTAQLENDIPIIRYIGAIWDDCHPVLDGLMPALAAAYEEIKFNLEFYGTSYAGVNLAEEQLSKWVQQNQMHKYTIEKPLRVPYRHAVMLTIQSDILLLIGGMQPYYAASKLMGLLISKKIFIAFVHEDSFPAKLLEELKFPYLVTYSQDALKLPVCRQEKLKQMIIKALKEKNEFKGVNTNHPLIIENTAEEMTKKFLEPISELIQ